MKTRTIFMTSSALVLSLLASVGLFVGSSFAQEDETNMTGTNETEAMTENQTEGLEGNDTQGPLEQLGEIFGFGGNESQ